MKKIILIFLLFFSFNAIGQDGIYITKVDTANGIESIKTRMLSDNDSLFNYEANSLRHFMYSDTSGTFELQEGALLISCHEVIVNGTTTLQFGNVKDHSIIYLYLEQDGTGGYTINLPTFENLDTQPVVSTVASKMDVLIIMVMSGKFYLHAYTRYDATF